MAVQQVFPLQPEDGRFHVLPGPIPELPLVHVRMRMNELCVDVLLGATAFSGLLTGGNACVCGLPDSPELPLVATLLSIAKTRARVMKRDPDGDGHLAPGCTHKLELSCWDDEGVKLALTIGLREADAGPIVEAAISGLLRATGALEAVVKAIEMERTTAGIVVGDKMTAAQVLDAATRPTVIKGKEISLHPAYRRYVARDVSQIGSRAYFCAAEAVKLGDEMRRVMDEKRNKDRRMRAVKRELRKAMEKAKTEKSGVQKGKSKKQEAFFADDDSEEQDIALNKPVDEKKPVKDENVAIVEQREIGPTAKDDKLVTDKDNTSREDVGVSSSQPEQTQKIKEESVHAEASQSEQKEIRKPVRKKKKRRLI